MKMLNSARFSRTGRIVFAAVLLCLGLSTIPASVASNTESSDNPVKQLSLEELGNVQVTTVSKEPEEVRKTSAAIYVITQDDIQRSGVTSIPDALRLAPGVEVARIEQPSKWSIGIRGFGSRLSRNVPGADRRTKRFIQPLLQRARIGKCKMYLLEDVERIEVIRGPGGTIWGPNAVERGN